jgi:hypothetical protein
MFGNRYPRKLESSLTEAAYLLHGQLEERALDQRQREFLHSIVGIQAGTLLQFAIEQQRDKAMRDFADAIVDPNSALRALRIATWALIARMPRSALAHRYPNTFEAALEIVRTDNDWERDVVDYESTSSVREVLEAPFDRLCVAAMIAVSTGVEAEPTDTAVIDWNARCLGAFVALREEMDERHPQKGFSRTAEVEAEIKARKAAEASDGRPEVRDHAGRRRAPLVQEVHLTRRQLTEATASHASDKQARR